LIFRCPCFVCSFNLYFPLFNHIFVSMSSVLVLFYTCFCFVYRFVSALKGPIKLHFVHYQVKSLNGAIKSIYNVWIRRPKYNLGSLCRVYCVSCIWQSLLSSRLLLLSFTYPFHFYYSHKVTYVIRLTLHNCVLFISSKL
jgi:hypothetical protein